MIKGWTCAGIVLALAGCSPERSPALMEQAREAILEVLEDPVSARFDNADAVALENQGLVCGGRVNFKDDWGRKTGFVPYYFHRERGVAHPTYNVTLYTALTRECVQALDSRRSSHSPDVTK